MKELEVKIWNERNTSKENDAPDKPMNFNEAFFLDSMNFCNANQYIPYLAIGVYHILFR